MKHWSKGIRKAARASSGTPAEIVLRILLLKHLRNWSFDVVEREVRTNLYTGNHTRGGAKCPTPKLSAARPGAGAGCYQQIHQRMVELAVGNKVVQAAGCAWIRPWSRPISITLPTVLSRDGTRVDAAHEKVTAIADGGNTLRDRMRACRSVMEIARAARVKGEKGKEDAALYRKLLAITDASRAAKRSRLRCHDVKRSADGRKQTASYCETRHRCPTRQVVATKARSSATIHTLKTSS